MGPAVPTRLFDLAVYLDIQRETVNKALTRIMDAGFCDSRLYQAMGYSLMGPGKRLRPVLCLAAAETIGDINEDVLNCACAIEMIHTYSLIHDDLPAMDDDQLRRGKPTCHVQFDEATAILAGDALLTLAFEILSARAGPPENASLGLQVIQIISQAAGHTGMIEGQMRDIAAETQTVDIDVLKRIHLLKTGALIKASVVTGALLAGGSPESIASLKIYAENIGLAFQVMDDILNVEGDAVKMGKATGTDAVRNKSTYPSLLGMDASREFAAQLVNNALHAIKIFGNKAVPLAALAEYIIKRER
jgi:geranylgeranyl diphosphate synthase type II